MESIGKNPDFGLASDDADGRAAAVAHAALGCKAVHRVKAAGGTVAAVEIQVRARIASWMCYAHSPV
jgi:hypothetical protein